MLNLKTTLWAAAVATLLSSCAASSDDDNQPTPTTPLATVTVTLSEGGAPGYPLREARVVSANYQTGSSDLVITGKLNNGKPLTLTFSRGAGTPPPFSTGAVEAVLDGATGTAATGTTTYNPQNRQVAGAFQATFPVIGVLSGSFTGIQL